MSRNSPAGEVLPVHDHLLLISVANPDGAVVLQSIWATTPGHRRTDVVRIDNLADLKRHLAELAPAICWDSAAPQIKAVP
jgi:hypothetical protein